MFNAPFTEMLLVLLGALLLVAAVIDVRTFTISNKLNLTVALLAPVYWLATATPLWPTPRSTWVPEPACSCCSPWPSTPG